MTTKYVNLVRASKHIAKEFGKGIGEDAIKSKIKEMQKGRRSPSGRPYKFIVTPIQTRKTHNNNNSLRFMSSSSNVGVKPAIQREKKKEVKDIRAIDMHQGGSRTTRAKRTTRRRTRKATRRSTRRRQK